MMRTIFFIFISLFSLSIYSNSYAANVRVSGNYCFHCGDEYGIIEPNINFPLVFYIVSNIKEIQYLIDEHINDGQDQDVSIFSNPEEVLSVPIYNGYIVINDLDSAEFHSGQVYDRIIDDIVRKYPHISIALLVDLLCNSRFGSIYVTSGIEPYENFEPVFESTVHFLNLEEFMKPNDPVHYSPIITNLMPGMKPLYLKVPFDGLP